MIAPQLTRAEFAYKTPNPSENRRLSYRVSALNCIFFPNLPLERFGWNATPRPRGRCAESL